MSESEFVLWTAWADYFATGEGRTLMGHICYARNEEEVRQRFGKAFDPYFAEGCDVAQGVARNATTRMLWSEEALAAIEGLDQRGAIEATSRIHFNFS